MVIFMISQTGKGTFDVILVTGDEYVDHPMFGIGIIARVLENAGYTVGVISQPNWQSKTEFLRLGCPRLFFGVTAGNMDSMVANYTPLKKNREFDAYTRDGKPGMRPNRATIVYCMRLRQCFKGVPLVIGGIEASLRRLAHYDYWDNAIRRSILFDSKADVLVYGMGEHAVVELANFYDSHDPTEVPIGIENTCIISKTIAAGHVEIPSFEDVSSSKESFLKSQILLSQHQLLAQKHADRYLVQFPMHIMSTKELDAVYSLPFTRGLGEKRRGRVPALDSVRFSVVSHRGCFGRCSFCALYCHQGGVIQSRSEEAIIKEVEKLTRMKGFRGTIDDIGGPTANMYGMTCNEPCKDQIGCFSCEKLDRSHTRMVRLLRALRSIPKIKHIFVSSGIRYDLAMESPIYLEDIIKHHVPGRIKVAPEHVNKYVLDLMGKPKIESYEKFLGLLKKIDPKIKVLPYFMAAHPGSGIPEMRELMEYVKKHGEFEQCQIFTPTPMTLSTCIYWTALDPSTRNKIYVPYTYHEKKLQKAMMLPSKKEFKGRLKELDNILDPVL
jgi:uncharacterized radical SAM protein YgiQ